MLLSSYVDDFSERSRIQDVNVGYAGCQPMIMTMITMHFVGGYSKQTNDGHDRHTVLLDCVDDQQKVFEYSRLRIMWYV